MNHERTEDLERGMDLIPKLAEIVPDQADERIRPIYEDIQRTLRVPFVNFIFRSLANYPDYFESAWGHLAPVLRTRAFETASDELRARALLEPVPDASGADWETLGDMDRIRPFSDSIHYVLPKLLLIATAFDEDVPGVKPEERYRSGIGGGNPAAKIPLGVAEGTKQVQMVDPKRATGQVKELFEDIRVRHDHPGVASYYRSLGQGPTSSRRPGSGSSRISVPRVRDAQAGAGQRCPGRGSRPAVRRRGASGPGARRSGGEDGRDQRDPGGVPLQADPGPAPRRGDGRGDAGRAGGGPKLGVQRSGPGLRWTATQGCATELRGAGSPLSCAERGRNRG